ncbi:MAG TPA: hypothetical protein PK646_05950 [Bacillota bacterium]|jgi:hypothetical protein|nr:hypothetical protein [Fastidiosipila sp.]HPX93786.1 hypothetical protein [Bacillota bacterium]HQB81611.1 hypothetical protein [Bacillota bacterium]
MSRWIFMAVVFILLPLTMLIFGLWFRIRPPGRPRDKDQERFWQFAQSRLARTWLILGGPMLAISTVVFLLVRGQSQSVIMAVGIALNTLQTLVLFASSLPTEISLRRHFDEEGRPRGKASGE